MNNQLHILSAKTKILLSLLFAAVVFFTSSSHVIAAPITISFDAEKTGEFSYGNGFSNPNVGAFTGIPSLSGLLTFDTDDIATSSVFATNDVVVSLDNINLGNPTRGFDALGRGRSIGIGGAPINQYFFFETSFDSNVRLEVYLYDDDLEIDGLSNAEIAADFPFNFFERLNLRVTPASGLSEYITYNASSFELITVPSTVSSPSTILILSLGLLAIGFFSNRPKIDL